MIYYGKELYHHGIKGQKWGVRRFQNYDGTYTSLGARRRRQDDESSISKKQYKNDKDTLKTVGKVLAVATVAGVSAYAIANNKEAVRKFLKNAGSKSLDALGKSVVRTGNAMCDAALMSIGTIAITKLASRFPTDDSLSDNTRYKNKLIFDTASAGIKTATNANGGSSGSGSTAVGAVVTEKIGAPSKKGLDKQSARYQNLFKTSSGEQRDSDTRAVIKSLASAGYDIDQLEGYVRAVENGSIKHSNDEIGYYTVFALLSSEFGEL